MNEKEISEIRRRFRADKSNITHVRGCYVNEKQEIVSQFDQPLSLLPQEECENLLSVLRRTLSGTLGKNLIEMSFTTAQVIDSDEHRRCATQSLPMKKPYGCFLRRSSHHTDPRARISFCSRTIHTTCRTAQRTAKRWRMPRRISIITFCVPSAP